MCVNPTKTAQRIALFSTHGVQSWIAWHSILLTLPMGNRAFHDAVLEANSMPIELLRALLTGELLTRNHAGCWRFADVESASAAL